MVCMQHNASSYFKRYHILYFLCLHQESSCHKKLFLRLLTSFWISEQFFFLRLMFLCIFPIKVACISNLHVYLSVNEVAWVATGSLSAGNGGDLWTLYMSGLHFLHGLAPGCEWTLMASMLMKGVELYTLTWWQRQWVLRCRLSDEWVWPPC